MGPTGVGELAVLGIWIWYRAGVRQKAMKILTRIQCGEGPAIFSLGQRGKREKGNAEQMPAGLLFCLVFKE